jgi:hypothetical protein
VGICQAESGVIAWGNYPCFCKKRPFSVLPAKDVAANLLLLKDDEQPGIRDFLLLTIASAIFLP